MSKKTWLRERRMYWSDVWKMKNGCQICGYNKHPKALSYDHLVPEDKNPIVKNGAEGIKTRGGGMWQLTNPNIPLREMIDEWRKCRILCMNCHMEQRYSNWNRTETKK